MNKTCLLKICKRKFFPDRNSSLKQIVKFCNVRNVYMKIALRFCTVYRRIANQSSLEKR